MNSISITAVDCSWPVISNGSGRVVYTIQYLLQYHGYNITADGQWGSATSKAVKSFQSTNGLTADGIVGQNTWLALIVTTSLNDRGYQVNAVQDQLKYHYNYQVSVDGIFGSGTQKAVVSFQSTRSLIANGVVDSPTWLDLVNDKCNNTSSPPPPPSSSTTVAQAIAASGCNTAVCAGLSQQLVVQLNCIQPGLFSDISKLKNIKLSSSAAAVPYLQTPASKDLQAAINDRGTTMTVNSALRTLPQQLMLYEWYLAGKCGITAAAKPGSSNHNGGLAVDINDATGWKSAMQRHNWVKLGDWDPPHFDYKGGSDVRSLSVLAFQRLWNKNYPNDLLGTDGIYGPSTEAAMLKSPVNGFPIGNSCV